MKRTLASTLDDHIRHRMESAHLPGLAAIAVRDGEVVWSGCYGHGNAEHRQAIAADTLFKVASISKVATAAAIMKAVEDEYIDLDTAVNEVLPFSVVHPGHTKAAITLRMLLSHTSGLSDNADVLEGLYVESDSGTSLRQFLQDYLRSGGRYYNASENFTQHAPGTGFEFCGIGLSLAAFVIECVTGQPFDGYCRRNVFDLLDMKHAQFRVGDAERPRVALPYRRHGVTRGYESYGIYWTPNYPDMGLHCSAAQLSRLFTVFTDMSLPGAPRVLEPETVQLMSTEAMPDIAPGIALGCYHEERDGVRLVGHAGADHGVAARMFWRADTRLGVVTLTNGEPTTKARWALNAIESSIFEMADEVAREARTDDSEPESTVIPFPRRHAS